MSATAARTRSAQFREPYVPGSFDDVVLDYYLGKLSDS
jgi:hypothetical protein